MTADDHDVLIVLVNTVEGGFREVNRRFDETDKKVDSLVQSTDKRLDKHDARITSLESRANKGIGIAVVLGGIFGVAGGKILHAMGF